MSCVTKLYTEFGVAGISGEMDMHFLGE
jgi:hypothetical protein